MATKDETRQERRTKRKGSNLVVWAILGLLILALGGFGVGGFGATVGNVATVGEVEVPVQDYARALQQEQGRLAEAGLPATIPQMRAFGLDGAVLARLLGAAALEDEARRMGLSAGDARVAAEIRANPAFGGAAGGFDREGYALVLRNAGLSEAEFERRTRSDLASAVLQGAVLGGVRAPDPAAELLAGWIATTRDLTMAEVTVDMLDGGALAPSEEDLRAFYEAEAPRFETPERKRITYAWLDPATLARAADVPEADLLAAYEARADEFRQPRRVLAERLAFPDEAAARAAAERIAAGEARFEDYLAERGLSLEDVDQGEVAEGDLSTEAAAAVFALDGPGIAGPVPTPLGPALYRVNAVLDATEVPLADVADELRLEIARAEAVSTVDGLRDAVDDALAGGATVEELEAEVAATLGTIDWTPRSAEGPAGYEAFREAAAAIGEGDFPEAVALDDGGLVALRLDAVLPAETPPLADIREEVERAWRVASTRDRLHDLARSLAQEIRDGAFFGDLGLDPRVVRDLGRGEPIPGASRTVSDAAFELGEPGEVLAVAGDEVSATILRLDGETPPDLSEGEGAALLDTVRGELARAYAADLFDLYGRAVQARAGVEVNQAAVNSVLTQLGDR